MTENSTKNRVDDLFKSVDFKLVDLLSHVKILANSTSEKTEFEIDYNDVNSYAMTMYDKVSTVIDELEELRLNFENL
jgi:hypothetical protein